MSVLVLLEHEPAGIKQPSRSAVAAASRLGVDVHVLVTGDAIEAAAGAAAALPGVAKVLRAEAEAYAHPLAEPLAALLVALAPGYTHLMAPATALGKNVMPRVAALLDVQPISDISGVEDADTFVRPIYAGNALATVRSSDATKVMTVRAASFDPVAVSGGSAVVEDAPAVASPGGSRFVSAELSRSERPELSAARVVVSGGRGMGSGRTSRCWSRSRTGWVRRWARRARRWTRATCRTTSRSGRPERSWRRSCISRSGFPGRSSISRA